MNDRIKKTRVDLDRIHRLDVSVDEAKQTVIAELIILGEEPFLIYAESFEVPCNYLRTAIKKGIAYIDCNSARKKENKSVEKAIQNILLSG